MSDHGAPIRLFDAARRAKAPLPPPDDGPVSVTRVTARTGSRPGARTLHELRAAAVADTLARLLTWKGYTVDREDPHDDCPPAVGGRVCVHATPRGTTDIWHLPVDGIGHGRFCMYHRPWHMERRAPDEADLADRGIPLDAFEFSLLTAGHYRRPRHAPCRDLMDGTLYWDATAARRRWAAFLRRHTPAPGITTHADAATRLSPAGRAVLAHFDRTISTDLNTPAALPTLYRAHRARDLPASDLTLLATVTTTLLPSLTTTPA